MTESKAIKKIKEFGLHHAIGDLPNSALTVKAFEMAISALERQTPKKPDNYAEIPESSGSTLEGDCPTCGATLCSVFNFCTDCGQAIDWRE